MDYLHSWLSRLSTLTRLHVVVITVSLCVTIVAWSALQHNIDNRRTERFERQTERLMDMVRERIANHEDALQVASMWLQFEPDAVPAGHWQRIIRSLSLGRRFPGVETLEFTGAQGTDGTRNEIRIRDALHALHIQEPEQKAQGSPDQTRLMLLPDLSDSLSTVPRYWLTSPLDRPDSGDSKTQNDLKYVYSPFAFTSIIDPVLQQGNRQIALQVIDADWTLLDETTGHDSVKTGRQMTREVILDFHGRQWRFIMYSNSRFMAATIGYAPTVMLICGVLLNGLLIGLFSTMENERRAWRATVRMGEHLVARSMELEASNQELERFACVVSHDLKSPLRGIESLAHWIAEDLAQDCPDSVAITRTNHHLERLHKRIHHMRALIDGILDYSAIDVDIAAVESVDLKILVEEILESNGFSWDAVELNIEVPSITASRVQLSQVLGNLLNNAFMHHPSPQTAYVSFSTTLAGDYCVMRVIDDGNGIDPADHERVFDFLDSLGSSHEDSTGIGLAIVKRIVERVGGRIRIEPAQRTGCCFIVHWPVSQSAEEPLPLAA